MNLRKKGSIFFIIIGGLLLLIGLYYGIFTVFAVTSTILSIIITLMFGAGIFLFKSEDPVKYQSKIRKNRFPHLGKSKFSAKIKDNKIDYDRKTDKVHFILSYKGKIKHGFIACEIIPPYSFDISVPNIDNKGHLSIFYDDSVRQIDRKQTVKNIKKDIANLCRGNYEINELEWSWEIPEFAPLGDYEVIIGIWDFQNNMERPKLYNTKS